MSVMSNVREESVEASMLPLDQNQHSAGDLSLPEDLRWRPETLQSHSLSAVQARRSRNSSGAWFNALYLLLAASTVVVAVYQIAWSVSW